MPPDEGPESEDCLHLNVWTPGLRDGGKRPVMVYFHGGGYTYGTVNSVLYDGNRLAHRGDAVVVTVNGRLNAFGFLYLAELGGPGFEDSGMAGQLDLVLALRWIHDNIAEFGGDASRVMIFGQSGGGGKCSTLMAMPPARGLVHRVICMSGQLIASAPRDRATERARSVLQELDLKPGNIDAIRTMPVAQIKQAARVAGSYGPVTDGRSLPQNPFWPQPAPVSLDVPLILGNTHDETRFLGGVPGVDLFALEWDGVVPALKASGASLRLQSGRDGGQIPRLASGVLAGRCLLPDHNRYPRLARRASCRRKTRWRSGNSEANVGLPNGLDLSRRGRSLQSAPYDGSAVRLRQRRSCSRNGGRTLEQQSRAQAMADAVSESYIAFAKTGNPNNGHVPKWPVFDLTRRPTMIFDDKVRTEDDPRGPERKYIEQVPYMPNV